MADEVPISGFNKRLLKQYAVYWPPVGTDDFGSITYGPAVEVRCRWEEVNELYINKNGAQAVSKSKVYVDRLLELDGMLWKGEKADLPGPLPSDTADASNIEAVNELPDGKAKRFLRWVML